jgi:hypothetical protein
VRLRQIALAANDLEPVLDDLCAVLGLAVGYRDPGVATFGLVNGLMPVGDTFLEVVSPERPGTTAGRWLDRQGGDAGYMVIVQTDDLAAERARFEALGVRVVWEIALDDIATVHLHPRDVGGAILSLDEARPPESWRWAGPDWKSHVRRDVVDAIVGVELGAEDPGAMARRWADVLGRDVRSDGDLHEIVLDAGAIRFAPDRDGRGDGMRAVAFSAVAPDRARVEARARGLLDEDGEIRIAGTRLRLV